MECKGVRTTGRHIPCVEINPVKYLPGFFELWLNKDDRLIINGSIIMEVYEGAERAPDLNGSIATVIKLD